MATQLDNLDDYDFAAPPHTVGVQKQPKYRESFINQEEQDDNGNPYDDLTDIPPDDESLIKPDYYIDRAPTPEYKPKEKGINTSTQIEQYEPELFDFILEVEPILQVIVGKTLEQARMELIEEEERAALNHHKSHFEKRRNAELMVTQRMEAAYSRRKEERERRQLQHSLHQEQLKLTQMKYISRTLSKLALRGTKKRVLSDLEKLGFLRDQKLMVLRQKTLPWLISKILNSTHQLKDHSKTFEKLILEIEKDTAFEHHKFYKIEMDRRAEILAARECVRVEKEDRQKRKIEIKSRRSIKEKRDALRKQIEENVLSKVEQFDNVFGVTIFEGITELQQTKPYILLQTDMLLLLSICLEFMVEDQQDQIEQIDDQLILNLWIDILKNKMSIPFNLNFNSQILQQFMAESDQDMERDPYLFNKSQKKQVITYIVEQLDNQIWSSYQNNLVHQISSKRLNRGLLQKLLTGLLDIQYKSINYRESDPVPEVELVPEGQGTQEIPLESPLVDPISNIQPPPQQSDEPLYEKPEVSELDLEMIAAKKLINFTFKEVQQQLPSINLLLRLHIPYYVQEPEKSNNNSFTVPSNNISHDQSRVITEPQPVQTLQTEQAQLEPEIKKSKWDFDPKTIDIYDGEKPLIREGKQIPLDEEQGYTYNFSNMITKQQVLVLDERGSYFARKQIYNFFKERLESFLNVVPREQFFQKFAELDLVIQMALEKEIKSANPETPIFDYEF